MLLPPKFATEEIKKTPYEKSIFIFKKSPDFLSLLWYCVVLTGGAVYGKHYKRAVAWQHHTARGQSDELKGDDRAPWVYGAT